MMWTETQLLLLVLSALSVCNALLSWQWRFEVYERYLALKYQVKNKFVYPIVFRD